MIHVDFLVASTADELQTVREMRIAVFVEEQGIPKNLDDDGLDATSIHVLAKNEKGLPIASGRLTIDGLHGSLSRIAVDRNFRMLGLGKQVVTKLESIAKSKGVRHLRLSPHAYLEKFYSDLGYTTEPGQKRVGRFTLLTMSKAI